MSGRRLLLSEGRLVWRDRWIIGLTIALLGLAIWAGPMGTLRYASSQLERLEGLRPVYKDQFTDFVLQDQATANLRETLLLLHPNTGVNYLLAILAVLGTMVLPIWGAHQIGSEFKYRTAKARAVSVGWSRVVLAKLVWLFWLSLALAVLFALVGTVSGQITWRAASESIWITEHLEPPSLTVSPLRQVLVTVMGLVLYGLFGSLIALVTRSAMAGGLAGLALPYIEALLVGAPSWGWVLPRIAYGNLMVTNFAYFAGGFVNAPMALVPPPAPWAPWAVVLLWILLFGWLTWLVSRRQEIG